jgi:hypothetical protein
LLAAPGELALALAPVLLAPEPEAPEPLMPEPVASLPLADVLVTMRTVVLLFALTTTVMLWLYMDPVPARTRVVMPLPTAGIPAGSGCVVMTAGCEVTTEGWAVITEGCEVATGNMPVTTPRELVWVIRERAGLGSTDAMEDAAETAD